jgi:hypothetical protein
MLGLAVRRFWRLRNFFSPLGALVASERWRMGDGMGATESR